MLKTKRLILRGPRADDLERMFAMYSDPRAMRYWSTTPHETREQTQDSLDRRRDAWRSRKTHFQIEMDGTLIGGAGNHMGNEVGFMLHPDHWRKGIVTEAMNAIIPHIWATTDHQTLTADADPMNAASVGLLKSLGFHETHRKARTFCLAGVWSDSVYFALARPSDD